MPNSLCYTPEQLGQSTRCTEPKCYSPSNSAIGFRFALFLLQQSTFTGLHVICTG